MLVNRVGAANGMGYYELSLDTARQFYNPKIRETSRDDAAPQHSLRFT
jgi:hypothetical protein